MHVRVVVTLSTSLVAVACHRGAARAPEPAGAGGGDPSAPLRAAAPHARPLFVRDGVAYLWLHRIEPYGEPPEWAPEPPACAADDPGCWTTLPAPAEHTARFGALPATLRVVTATGTCVATVGPIAIVNTSGCEPTMAYAAPLTGCGAAVAPVGFAGGELPADLRWLPRPAVVPADVPADPAQLPDPLQRRLVSGWLAEPDFTASPRHQTHTTVVAADAGEEALVTIMTAALVGAGEDQCAWEVPQRGAVGLRRGDQLRALVVDEMWDGALAWRGRVVAVVSGLPTDVNVTAIGPADQLTPVLARSIWWDNAECLQASWTGVEYPCGL